MHRLLTTTAVALLLGVAPALAIDDPAQDQSNTVPEASQSNESSSTLPSQPGMTPDASEPGQPHAANEASETQVGEGPLTQVGEGPFANQPQPVYPDGQPPTQPGMSPGAASAGGGTADAASPDISGGDDANLEKGPTAAERPDSEMESDMSKE